jgi:hypothetical protein
MMGLFVDDILAKFPTKTIPTISGEPYYASISNMVQLMYGNAASLPTSLGGGQHSHIGLIMTPILYATAADGEKSPIELEVFGIATGLHFNVDAVPLPVFARMSCLNCRKKFNR